MSGTGFFQEILLGSCWARQQWRREDFWTGNGLKSKFSNPKANIP
ncbi:hypothetical protein [[Phormidium] sp. ETS-05]|nr:hypothetical protein [[Phormidium] sp. ETS-05]